ncbi:glyoxalase [Kiloniella spongiae]|uniref:Glyoxalase n=1 Tax=Kiloniella spongiae TaxID=1489064 RepID=A0A0H2MM48_9PROT|nr:VOC family protein [Kiloniella spongiae]KLN61817.1 glyoxalase [Kiloniella spongiae]
MQLAYTILYVQNVPSTLEFYQKAFDLKQKMLHESGDYGELDTGQTTLSFSSISLMKELGKKPSSPQRDHPSFEIAFTTDDVSQAFDRALKSGAIPIQKPAEMPWGQVTAYVTDLNGFLIEICTPIKN